MSEVEGEEEKVRAGKAPWVWKAAIVGLPAGLVISIIIAMALKISKGTPSELAEVEYAASNYNPKSLADSVSKLENLVGRRDLTTEAGQQQMRSATALIAGSLSPNNLGYEVSSEVVLKEGDKVWRNYWITRETAGSNGTLLIWTSYLEPKNSPSVAALFSLAEWMRGRNFEREVVLAFTANPSRLDEIASGKDVILVELKDIGRGSQELEIIKTNGGRNRIWQGDSASVSAADWKLTAGWDYFLRQVTEICEQTAELADEKVLR